MWPYLAYRQLCSALTQAPPSRRQEALPSLKWSMPNILITGFLTRSAIEELATIGGRDQKCVAQP